MKWLDNMNISTAIVIAAIVLGLCYLGSNLYKVERINDNTYVRINSLTGSMVQCRAHLAC